MDKVYSEEQLKYILLAFYSKREKLLDAVALTLITKDLVDTFWKKPKNASRKYSETVFSCCICEEKEKIFKILWKKYKLKVENGTEATSEEAARKAWSDIVESQNGECYITATVENANGINQNLLQKHVLEACITEVVDLTKPELDWSILTKPIKTELEECFASIMTINDNTQPVLTEFKPGLRKWGLHNIYLTLLTSGKAIAYANFLQNIRSVGIQIRATRNPSSAVAIKYIICKQCLRETDRKRPLSITDVFSQCITDFANNEFFSPLRFPDDVSGGVAKEVTTSSISADGMPMISEGSMNGCGIDSSSDKKLKPVRKSGRGKISSKKDQSFVYYSNIDDNVRSDGKRTLNSKKTLQTNRQKSFSKKRPNLDIIVIKTSEPQDALQVSQTTNPPSTSKDVSPITNTSSAVSPVAPSSVSNDDKKAVSTLQQSQESNKPKNTTLNNTSDQLVRMRHIGTNKVVVVPASTLLDAQQKGCLVPVKLSSINMSININNNKGAQELNKGVSLPLNNANQLFGSVAPQKKPLVVQIVNGRVRKGTGATKNFSKTDTSDKTRLNNVKKLLIKNGRKYGADSGSANGLQTSIKNVPISPTHVKFVKSVHLKNPLSYASEGLKSTGSSQIKSFMKVEVPISKYSQTRPKTLYFNNINQIPLLPVNPANLVKFPFVRRPDNPVVNNNAFTKVKLRIAGNRKFVIKDNFQPNETTRFNSVINKPTMAPTLPKQIQKLTTPKKSGLRQLISPSKTPSKRRSFKIESKSMPTIVAEYMLEHVPSANQELKKNLKKKAKKRVEKSTSFIPVPYETNFLCINDTIERLGWKAYWYRKCRCSKIREKAMDAAFEEEEGHPKQEDIASWLPRKLTQRTNDVLLENLEEKTNSSCEDNKGDIEAKLASRAKLTELFQRIARLTKEASKVKSPKLLLKCSPKLPATNCFPVTKPDFVANPVDLSKVKSDVSSTGGFPTVKCNFSSSSCSSKLPSSSCSSAVKTTLVKPTTNSSTDGASTTKGAFVKSPTNCLNVKSRKRKLLDQPNEIRLPKPPPVRLMAKYKKDKDGNWTAMPSEVSTIIESTSETSPRLSDLPESNAEESVMLNIKSGFQCNSATLVHMEDRMGMTHDHGVRRCARTTMLRRKALMKRASDAELKSKTRREKTELHASGNLLFSSFTDQSMTDPIFDLVSPHPMCFRDNPDVMIKVLKSRDDKSAASQCLLIKDKIVVDPNTKKYQENPFYSYLTSPHPLSSGAKLKMPKDVVKHSVHKASVSQKEFLRKNNDAFGGQLVNKLESIWNQGGPASSKYESDIPTSKSNNTVKIMPLSYRRKDPTVVNQIIHALAIKNLSNLRAVFPAQDTSEISSESAEFIVSAVKSERDIRNDSKIKKHDQVNQNAPTPLPNHIQPNIEVIDHAEIATSLSENGQDVQTEIDGRMENEQKIVEQSDNLNEETVVDVTETEDLSGYDRLSEGVRLFPEIDHSIDDVPCSSKSLHDITTQSPASTSPKQENSESSEEDVDIGDCANSNINLSKELDFSQEAGGEADRLIINEDIAESDSKDETIVDVCSIPTNMDVCKRNIAKRVSLTSTPPTAFLEIFDFVKRIFKTDIISPEFNYGANKGIHAQLRKKLSATTRLSNMLSSKYCFGFTGEILQKSDPSKRRTCSNAYLRRRKRPSTAMQFQCLQKLRQSRDMKTINTSTTLQEDISAESINDDLVNIDLEELSIPRLGNDQSPQANASSDVSVSSPEIVRGNSPQNQEPVVDIVQSPDFHISDRDSNSVLCDLIENADTSTLTRRSDSNSAKMPDSAPIETLHKEDHEAGPSTEFRLGEIVANSSPKKRRRDWSSTALNGLYWSQVIDFSGSDSGRCGLNLRRRQVNSDDPKVLRNLVNKRKRLGHGYLSSQNLNEILEADKSSLRKHGFHKLSESDSDDFSEDEDSSADEPLQSLFTKSLNVERVRSWMLGSTCPKPLILKSTSQITNAFFPNGEDISSVNSSPVAAKRRKRKANTMPRQQRDDHEQATTSYNTLTDDLTPLISRAYVPLVRCSANLNEASLAIPDVQCTNSEKELPIGNRFFVVKKRSASSERRPKGITRTKRRQKDRFKALDRNNNASSITSTIFTIPGRAVKSNYARTTSTSGVYAFSTATQNVSDDTEIDIDVESLSSPTQDESNLRHNYGAFSATRLVRKCRIAAEKNGDNVKREVAEKKSFRKRMNLRDRGGEDTVQGRQNNHNGRSNRPLKWRTKGEKNRLQSIRRAVFAEIKDSPQNGEEQANKRGRMLLKSRCATKGSFLSRLLGYDTDGVLV